MVWGTLLSALLAKPHAVSALLYLRANPGVSANALSRGMGGSGPAAGVAMARHLEAYGVAVIRMRASQIPGQDAMEIDLTAKGADVADSLIGALEAFPDPVPEIPRLPKARPLREGRDATKKPK